MKAAFGSSLWKSFALAALASWVFAATAQASGDDDEALAGYKQFRFGTLHSKIKKLKPCALGPKQQQENGLEVAECEGFPWGITRAKAAFGFLRNRLQLVSLTIPRAQAAGAMDVLGEKYGVPSRSSTAEEFHEAESAGHDAEVCFAGNAVCAIHTWNGSVAVLTIRYTPTNFEELLAEFRKEKLMSDL